MTTIKDYLIQKFWDDYSSNFTPDTPELRYEGPIPVFLYSDYSGWNFPSGVMKEDKLNIPECLKFVSNNCMTKHKTVYLRDVSDKSKYKAYLIPTFMSNIKGYSLTKRKTRGTLYTVSLKGIQALDRFFYNGHHFNRVLVDMEKGDHGIKSAYTYFVKPTYIADCVAEGEYELLHSMKLKLPIGASSKGGEIVHL